MAIASMVCGIVGLFILLTFYLILFVIYGSFDLYYYLSDYGQLIILYSIILLALALIFGIIERRKRKDVKNYTMANSGIIMGLTGLLINIALPTGIYAIDIYYQKILSKTNVPDWGISHDYYSIYKDIGLITTKTRDNHTVEVEIVLGCDFDDSVTLSTLAGIQPELQDFFKDYFTRWDADELTLENERWLKQNILELINTRFMGVGKVRIIFFNQLDIIK